jgi:hypothetical protein
MTDTEIRSILLRLFYEKRQWRWLNLYQSLPAGIGIEEAARICEQLAEHGLIEWKALNRHLAGMGHITAHGVDVMEGNVAPPISVSIDHSKNISVSGSTNVQIGDGNVQDFSNHLQAIVRAIEAAPGTPEQKQEAKSMLCKFLAHPLIAAIAGGLAGTL